MKSLRWRMAVSVAVLLVSLAYALPSMPGIGTALRSVLPDARINLGLDLKGGIHLTLGVDVQKAVENALLQTGQDVRTQASEEGLTVLGVRLGPGGKLEFLLPKAEQRAKLEEMLAKNYAQLQLDAPAPQSSGALRFTASLTPAFSARTADMALDQAVRTIRNRIDQFGVAEPDIRKQADHRIQIQLPGLSDANRAIQLVGQTAQLTFHLVRDDLDPKSTLPPGVALFPMVEKGTGSVGQTVIALDRDPLMTGEDVSDARPGYDQSNNSMVSLGFNGRGATTFARVTGEHVKRRMAIVLDGKVYTAPTINERISGGKASITGNFTVEEAQDLAIVLRAGSLPAPVTVLEERTVGPSLGKESIEKGLLAAIVGGIAVVVIMPIYYGLSGLLADIMLCFTMTLLMAGLAGFGATLTLPGIAGIVLTIGMSVDANVLIFERIREELRLGIKPVEAIAAGFERASISIMDSNVTTIIAAAILYQFGTGPVRGFAVTLTLGILASMFTAIFVSKAAFAMWMDKNGGKSLSI